MRKLSNAVKSQPIQAQAISALVVSMIFGLMGIGCAAKPAPGQTSIQTDTPSNPKNAVRNPRLKPYNKEITRGVAIFASNCSSCHSHGGNDVDPRKPIRGSHKLASRDLFKGLLEKPSGIMPAAPQIARDDKALDALYAYCKSLK